MASYSQLVVADSPLFYWKMNETSGTELAATVGSTPITLGTLTAKPTLGVAGADAALGTAVQFDGTNDIASAAIDLSARSAVVLEFWLYWDAYAPNDDMALEYGVGGASLVAGFYVDPNFSVDGTFAASIGTGGDTGKITRPSAAAWHHYAISLDRAQAGGAEVVYMVVDGVSASITHVAGANAGNFSNLTLTLMHRGDGSLFGAGRMQHLAIYSSLSLANAQAHYAARANEPSGGGGDDWTSPMRTPDRTPDSTPQDRLRILRNPGRRQ